MKTILASVFVSIAILTSAGMATAAAIREDYAYVSSVSVGDDNNLNIAVAGNFKHSQAQGCTDPSHAESKYPVSDDRTKAWMSIALTSLIARTKVYVTTDGCTATTSRPKLVGIEIEREISPGVQPIGIRCGGGEKCCNQLSDGSCAVGSCVAEGTPCGIACAVGKICCSSYPDGSCRRACVSED